MRFNVNNLEKVALVKTNEELKEVNEENRKTVCGFNLSLVSYAVLGNYPASLLASAFQSVDLISFPIASLEN